MTYSGKSVFAAIICLFAIVGCGDQAESNNSIVPALAESADAKRESNVIQQQMPSVMVMPSDALLKRLGCLTEVTSISGTQYVRDYQKSFINDSELKFAVAAIEGQFSKSGYNLENLEQTLKLLANNSAMSLAEGVKTDVRTELLNTARPDYIIELDYELREDKNARSINKTLTYIVKCLDVYTNKTISSVTRTDVGKNSSSNEISSLISEDLPGSISELSAGINTHFKDVLANGAEITLRLTVMEKSSTAFDDYCGDDEIGEMIVQWLKENTINSSFKMVKNTSNELFFTNVRIHTSQGGTAYSAYDFAKDLKNGLRKGCGLDAKNVTQSLGDAYVQVN